MSSEDAQNFTPREIYIGPYRYEVEFDPNASWDYGYLGVTLNRTRRIKLNPLQSDTELPQTLLHEVLHAIGSAYEIKEWAAHKRDKDRPDIVADQIDLMASGLLQFLRANPKLAKWLIEQR